MPFRSPGAFSHAFVLQARAYQRFSHQTLYYRRIRDKSCYIGERLTQPHKEVRDCACTEDDFEWCVPSSSSC